MCDEFYRTWMGHQFFNSAIPKIAEELERLNKNLEALWHALERITPTPGAVADPDQRGAIR